MREAVSDPAIPAATLILIRDRAGAAPELLIIERAARMSFAGGALVFPGGRVDPGDILLASADEGDVDERAARIAAIRETIEEANVAVGLIPKADAATVAALRAGLAAGGDFGTLLADAGLALDAEALVPFARWRPPPQSGRIFDTRFYLARAPAASEPLADGGETVAAFWMSADEVLAKVARGEGRIVFPTRRTLERLARFACFDEAAADAARHPVITITTRVERRDGVEWLHIPDGLGYPIISERADFTFRG